MMITNTKQFRLSLTLLMALSGLMLSPQTMASSNCIAYLQYTQGYWQVWLMDDNGKKQKQITQSKYDKSSLSWYPDAKALLINGIQGKLYKVDVETGREQEINIGLKGMFDAVLSPDGQNISFGLSTSGSRDDHNIWHVDLKTKEILKLTNLKQMQHLPRWSADGKWIYFSSKTDDQHNDILRVPAQGEGKGEKIDTITINALYNFDAVESLDHNILFSSNRTGSYELWKQDSDGQLTQLTDRQARDARPDWSSDGQQIAFESSHGGQMNIWKILQGVNTNEPIQITHTETGARYPVWSPVNQQGLCD